MMKNESLMLVGLALFGVMASGCSTLSKSYPLSTPPIVVDPLHRNEYLVLGDTEGEASASYLFGARLPWFSGQPTKTINRVASGNAGFLASIPFLGALFSGTESTVDEALYEAIEKMPGADSIMSVRTERHNKFRIPFIYSREEVKVKGKAFKIKIDKP